MKQATILTTMGVLIGLSGPVHGELPCADWFTEDFFSAATVQYVSNCLRENANISGRDEEGRTPLHLAAAAASDAAIVAELLRGGADFKLTDANGQRPIHAAAEKGRTPSILSYLLVWGSDPNIQMSGERCSWRSIARCATGPLHLASARPDGAEYVAALIAADADTDMRDEKGQSALQHAAANAHDVLSVALLLQAGAARNIADFDGLTPLHAAARRGEGAPEIVAALLAAGASADAGDLRGTTPVIWAARTAPDSRIMAMLIDAATNPCTADNQERTALSQWDLNANLARDDVYWALHDRCTQ